MSDSTRLQYTMVRHAQTVDNSAKIYLDNDDPLSELGRRQAAALATRLAGVSFEMVVHSGSVRTTETLSFVLKTAKVHKVTTEPLLREGEIGSWVGQPTILRKHESMRGVPLWDVRPPGGESYVDIDLRLRPIIEALVQGEFGAKVLLVGHGRVNTLILRRLESIDWPEYVGNQQIHASVTRFEVDRGRCSISFKEDHSHLTPELVTR